MARDRLLAAASLFTLRPAHCAAVAVDVRATPRHLQQAVEETERGNDERPAAAEKSSDPDAQQEALASDNVFLSKLRRLGFALARQAVSAAFNGGICPVDAESGSDVGTIRNYERNGKSVSNGIGSYQSLAVGFAVK